MTKARQGNIQVENQASRSCKSGTQKKQWWKRIKN